MATISPATSKTTQTYRLSMKKKQDSAGTSKFTVYLDQDTLTNMGVKVEELKDSNYTFCGSTNCNMVTSNQLCDKCKTISPLCLVTNALYYGHKRMYGVLLDIDTSPQVSQWTLSVDKV